jgi:hypothetical protein
MSGQLHVPGIHWIGGWVSPRAGLEPVEKREHIVYSRTMKPKKGAKVHKEREKE